MSVMIRNRQLIAVLMATYNGEKYIREQIDSILNQTFTDWHLYIHDDGSADDTVAIISDYAERYPDKVSVLDYPPQGGPCRNFFSLLDTVDASYYMFSDQDDVWLEDKIGLEFSQMLAFEGSMKGRPLLVATDLKVVDENLNEVCPSLWSMAGIYPQYIHTFDEVAANTLVTGCTILFNNALKMVSLPVSNRATMHDAWISCCLLKYGGKMKCLPESTVLYRQHSEQTLGAQNVVQRTFLDRVMNISRIWGINRRHYLMLRELSYGSFWRYAYFKLLYHKRIVSGQKK